MISHRLFLGFAALGVAAAGEDGFRLALLKDPTAVCLDGTPAGYYKRPGTSSSWVLELEGGGWCINEQDCLSRATTDLGSSKSWPATGCPAMDGGSNGMLSNNCSVSPLCTWTAVHLNYCDGASFAGFRADPVNVSGSAQQQLFFRGRRILDATIDALLADGMNAATEIVFKGCSAGGLATILHMDYFRSRVHAVNPSCRVTAMPDAGFFMDLNNTKGEPSFTPHYKYVAEMQNTTAEGAVNDACLAHYDPLGERWKCFMAQYTLPFLTTPYFMTQDLVDSWQMPEIAQLPCAAGNFTDACLADMSAYRAQMLAALAPLVNATDSANGGFISACYQHCHQNSERWFGVERVQNQTVQSTWESWYAAGSDGGLGLVVAGEFAVGNPDCRSTYCLGLGTAWVDQNARREYEIV